MPALLEAVLPPTTPHRLPRGTTFGLAALWTVLLAAILIHPIVTDSPLLGEEWTRNTVRLSMACYAAAALLMLVLRPEDWAAGGRNIRVARCLWTLAYIAYMVHLAAAFHFYHGWSHAHAFEHVRQRSGVGEGIFVSHLFTLLWTLDVLGWWLAERRYALRPAWIGWTLHAFLSFVVFNGTVVYETGPIQWGGVIYFTLAALLLVRRLTLHRLGHN